MGNRNSERGVETLSLLYGHERDRAKGIQASSKYALGIRSRSGISPELQRAKKSQFLRRLQGLSLMMLGIHLVHAK